MNHGKRTIRIFGLSFIIFVSCVLCRVPCAVFAQDMMQTVNGFVLEGYTKEGDRAWEVKGKTADVLGNTIKIENVDANKYGGDQDVNLKAKHGELDKTSGDVHLRDDVVVTTASGDTLQTNSLDWEKKKNIVHTADEAEITHKTMKAKGKGFKASPGLKTAQLDKDVTVTADISNDKAKKEEIVATCDGPMEMDQQNNVATLKEHVVAVRGDQTLKADQVEINFDPKTKKVVTIICTNHVSVQQGDNITYADKAIYSAADRKVIFVGRPKLIMKTKQGNGQLF